MVNWQDNVDHLRCNESFFGQERYDHVIIATGGKSLVAKLLSLFKFQVGNHSHSLALIRDPHPSSYPEPG
jgi:hypothetical protein